MANLLSTARSNIRRAACGLARSSRWLVAISAACSITAGASAQVRISALYGSGGNGPTPAYNADFVELYNAGNNPVDFAATNYLLQYASAGGSSWTNFVINFGVIQPHGFFLVRTKAAGANGAPIQADFAGTSIDMSASNGKIALYGVGSATNTAACPVTTSLADFVGWGSATCREPISSGSTSDNAPGQSTTSVMLVRGDPNADTDNNARDFMIVTTGTGTGYPRNTSTVPTTNGVAAAAYGSALAVQNTQTGYGDATSGNNQTANGSELDQLFGTIVNGELHVTLAGNLESNGNKLVLFIDSVGGGQNNLRGDNAGIDRMGVNGGPANTGGGGMTLPGGMAADYWFAFNVTSALFVDGGTLPTSAGGTSSFFGSNSTFAGGSGVLSGGTANGVRATLNNSNTLGVTAGNGAASGAGVSRGVEMAIPLSVIGSPAGNVTVFAMVMSSDYAGSANQSLGGCASCGNFNDSSFRNWSTSLATPVTVPTTMPVITAQPPASVQQCAGSTSMISVAATGSNLLYRWQQSTDAGATWVDAGGSGTAAATMTTDGGAISGTLFRCQIVGPRGTVISSITSLTVNALPATPTGTTAYVGSPSVQVSMPVTVGGGEVADWRAGAACSGTVIFTGDTLAFTPPTYGTYQFTVQARNAAAGCLSTGCLSITLDVPPPNDACGSAAALTLDTPLTGTTESATADYTIPTGNPPYAGVGQITTSTAPGRDVVYTFIAPGTADYSVRVTGYSNSQNPILYVLSACPGSPGTIGVSDILSANNRDNDSRGEEAMCLPLTAGQQVWVVVDDAGASNFGSDFEIEVTRCIREVEPNDTPAAATVMVMSSEGMEGSISPMGDADYYSIGTPAAGSRVFAMVDAVAAGTNGDLAMRVTDTTDTLEFDDDNGDTPYSTTGQAPVIAGTIANGNPLFLRVTAFAASQTLEPYRVYATIRPSSASATAESEPNDSTGNANSDPGNFFSGSLVSASDSDLYALTATAGQMIFVGLDTLPSRIGTAFDGQLALLDALGGTLVAVNGSSDSATTTPNPGVGLSANTPNVPAEGILWRARYTGTYYVRVNTTSVGGPFPYLVSAGLGAPPVGGACCVGTVCSVSDDLACAAAGGTFQGAMSTCTPDPCAPMTVGACCDSVGVCTIVTSANCSAGGGFYFGDGSSCSPTPCPTGACCATGTCTVLTANACAAMSGSYKGDASTCAGQPAPAAPTGATADVTSYCAGSGPANISLSAACVSGETIQWFTDSCGGTSIGTGSPLVVAAPGTSTTFYARCVSDCGELSTCSTVDIVVVPLPTAPASAASDVTAYCANAVPGTISLTASGGSGLTLNWSADSCGGTSIGTGSPLVIAGPTATTTYYAQWTSPCGASTCASVTVTVNPLPVAPTSAASSVTSYCADAVPGTISLSASGGTGDTLEWFSGSCGGTSVGAGSPLVITAPTSTTSYHARWTNACGSSACASVTITVNPLPVAPASAASSVTSYCSDAVPATISLSASGGSGDTLEWFSGSCGGTAIGTGTPLNTAAPGATTTYFARWTNACGSSTCASVTVTVNPTPTAPASAASDVTSYCADAAPATVSLSASGGSGDTLEWFSGSCGGTSVGTGSPLVITAPTSTTSYHARWTNACGSSTCADVTVSVQAAPTAHAGGPYSVVGQTPVAISGSAGNTASTLWTSSGTGAFGDASSLATNYTPSAADETAGSVTLTLTANPTAPCATPATSNATLTITACTGPVAPTSVTTSISSICAGSSGSLTLTAVGGSGDTVQWFDDTCGGNMIGTGNPLVVAFPAATTTYFARWTNTCGDSGCASATVTVTPAPTVDAGTAADTCGQVAVSLSGSGTNAASYLWTGGAGTFTDATNPMTTYTPGTSETGPVTLTLTATGNSPCTTAFDTVSFNVVAPPTALAGPSLSVSGCSAFPVALSGSVSNAANSLWTTSGTGTFADATSPATTYTVSPADVTAGTVTLTLTAQPNAPCATPAASSLTLTVLPPLTTAFVDDDYVGLPNGTEVTYPAVGGTGPHMIGCDAFASIQAALNAVTGSTVNVAPGTYDEDLNIAINNTNLVGSGAAVTIVRGVPTGHPNDLGSATLQVIGKSGVTISGLTITRLGNTAATWDDPLNNNGLLASSSPGLTVHDCIITGNRNGVNLQFMDNATLRNNVIDFNRTGLQCVDNVTNSTFTQNAITNNWTIGVLFRDETPGGSDTTGTAFTNNNISGNWYAQIEYRNPDAHPLTLKDFSGNWLGTTTPTQQPSNGGEPGYSAQVPVAYGGTAVPPGPGPGVADVKGDAIASFDITPMLASGTDTDVSTGLGTFGFQGGHSALAVTSQLAQTGPTGRVQEGHDAADAAGSVSVDAGTFSENLVITKQVTIDGAGSGDCATGADPLTQTVLSAANPALPTVSISDAGGASDSARLTLRDLRVTGSTAAGVRFTSVALRSFFLLDNLAVAANTGPGVEFAGSGSFADARVTNSSLCSNARGVQNSTTLASLDGLTIDNCEVRDNTFNGLGVFGDSTSGFNPTNIAVSNSQFSANGTSSNLFQGSGDLSFYEFNGNASITDVTIATTGRVPVQFRGRGTDGSPGTWLPAGTVAIDGLTVTGSADRPAMYIQVYSDVSGFSLNDVDLTGVTSVSPPNTAFSVAGMILDHTGATPLELGNTAFPCPGGGYASLAVYNTGGAHASCSTSFAGATTLAQKETCVVDADDPFSLPGQVSFDDAIVITPPAAGSVCTGGMFTFTVSVSGLGPISYQWRHDGNPVGADSNSFAITNATAADAGGYSVDITNPCGTVTSGPVSLSVLPLPVAPSSVTASTSSICAGDSGSLTLTAVGGSGDTVQWFDDTCGGTSIGSGSPLVIAYPASTTTYHARWTNTCGDSGCASATVTVTTPPTAPAGVASDVTAYCANAVPATISLTASGGSGLTLNWYADSCGGTSIGSGSPLVIAAPATTTTYYARWEAAPCVPSTCASVTVTVNPLPVAPSSAASDVTAYCSDAAPATISLSASGGSGDTLEWFSGSCGGTSVGTGSPLVIAAPASTTSYHARWTNACGSSTCADVTVNVQAAPTAGAGGPYSVIGQTPVAISGSASNAASTTWTSSGTGVFADASSLSTTYTPSPADETAGSVTLTLTASPTAPCATPAASNAALTITACAAGPVAYADDDYIGLPFGTAVNWPANGSAGPHMIGCDAFASIQAALNAVTGSTVNVAPGTYDEDLNIAINNTNLVGSGAAVTIVRGVPTGHPNDLGSATLQVIGKSGVTISGLTITRLGNTAATWDDPLNNNGLLASSSPGLTVHDCIITGNRNGVNLQFMDNATLRNNVIDFNRTGLQCVDNVTNSTFTQNAITNNWTIGVLFRDETPGGSDTTGTAFTNNNISGNWYAQIEYRNPDAHPLTLKDFSGNWLGTTTPTQQPSNGGEPGYSAQVPVAYGGTAVPPGPGPGVADVKGDAIASFDITPMLASGTDTDVSTGLGTFGFQGGHSALAVTSQLAQTGPTGRVQEGHDAADAAGSVSVDAGTFSENLVITKQVTIDGAGSGDCATGADPLTQTVLSAANPALPTVSISDAGGASDSARLTLRDLRVTGSTAAGVRFTSVALRSFFLLDNLAVAANTGPGVEFAGSGSFADARVTNSSLCSNARGVQNSTTLASLDGLTIDNCEVRDNTFNGLGVFGDSTSGFNPTNIAVSNSQFSANGTSSNLFQGSGDLSFYEFNGNASITDVTIATTGRVPVQFRGRGTDGSPGTWLPAGTVAIDGLTVTGSADRPAMYIQVYSDVSGFSLNDVDLTGVTSVSPPNTAFSVAGMILDHTGATPLELGNTAFPCPGGGYASLAVYNTGGAHASCSTSFAGATTLAQKETCVVDADDPFSLPGQVSFDDPDILTPITGGGVCVGGMFTFTVSATGAGPLSYQWFNGATPVGTDSNSYAITSATLADTGSYTVAVTNACGSVTSNAVMLNVFPNPAAPTGAGADVTSFCSGSPPAGISLTATGGTGDTLVWYANSCGGTPIGMGSPLMVAAPVATTTYFASWETTNCGASTCASVTVTVNASPVAPTGASSDVTSYCSASAPGTINLTASGGSGDTLEWFSGSCGGTPIGMGSPLSITAPTSTTTYYARWTTALCGSSACADVTVTVNASPVDPVSASSDVTSYCVASAPGMISLSASGGSGDTLEWYAGSCGGAPIGTGSPLNIAAPGSTTIYFARWTTALCGNSACASVTVTVNANPGSPTGLNASPATICDSGPVTLTASVGPGETVDWFANASCGGSPIGSGSPFNTTVSGTTSFYARARDLATGCTSPCVGPVTANVYQSPAAPTSAGASSTSFCAGSLGTITLTAVGGSGDTLAWYSGSCAGTPIGTGSPLVIAAPGATTAYFARWETANCGASACADVTVNVQAAPVVSAGGPYGICADGVAALTGSAMNAASVAWTTSGTGSFLDPSSETTVYMPSPADVTAGSIVLTLTAQPIAPCSGAAISMATVSIQPLPTPPTGASVNNTNFCAGSVSDITLSATGGSGDQLAWYAGSCGGTAVGNGSPLTIAAPANTTTYFARWINACGGSACASVTVTVYQNPVAPTSVSLSQDTWCAGSGPANITLGAVGGSGDTFEWFTGSCGGTPVGTGTSLSIPAPSATTIYYGRWSTAHCGASTCAQATVTVNPLPVAPTSASVDAPTYCENSGPGNISLTAAGGSGDTLKWYTGSCGGVLIGSGSPLVTAAPITTTTYYARWETATCGASACASVTVTVTPLPVAPTMLTSSADNYCSTSVASLTLTAFGGSGDTLEWFDDSCGGNQIGTGSPLVITAPLTTTTYYARWTNVCGESTCAQVTVTVTPAVGACCSGYGLGKTCQVVAPGMCNPSPTPDGAYRGDCTVCMPTTCCPADYNNNGIVSVQDIFDFLAAYFAGNFNSDFNNNTFISVQDIFDFLASYFAGC